VPGRQAAAPAAGGSTANDRGMRPKKPAKGSDGLAYVAIQASAVLSVPAGAPASRQEADHAPFGNSWVGSAAEIATSAATSAASSIVGLAEHAGVECLGTGEGEGVGKGMHKTIVSVEAVVTSPSTACVLAAEPGGHIPMTSAQSTAKMRATRKQTRLTLELQDLAQCQSEQAEEKIAAPGHQATEYEEEDVQVQAKE